MNISRADGRDISQIEQFGTNQTYRLNVSLVSRDMLYRGLRAQVGGTTIRLSMRNNLAGCSFAVGAGNFEDFTDVSFKSGEMFRNDVSFRCSDVYAGIQNFVTDEIDFTSVNNFTQFVSPSFDTFGAYNLPPFHHVGSCFTISFGRRLSWQAGGPKRQFSFLCCPRGSH